MSSIRLSTLIDEFPDEREAIYRLNKLVVKSKEKNSPVEFSPQRLFDLVMPSSLRVLTQILSKFSEWGELKKVIRVESRARGGIGEFNSILDVPLMIYDSRLGYEIEVEPDQIKMIYIINF